MSLEEGKETLDSTLVQAFQGISSFSEELAKFKAQALSLALPIGERHENQALHRPAL